jgi:hypothetical protein
LGIAAQKPIAVQRLHRDVKSRAQKSPWRERAENLYKKNAQNIRLQVKRSARHFRYCLLRRERAGGVRNSEADFASLHHDDAIGLNMRSVVSLLTSLIIAGILLFGSVVATLAEDDAANAKREARQQWYSLASGRTEFDVSDPTSVPSALGLAAEQSGCLYKDGIKELPVRFISVEKRRLALVFCRHGVTGSDQLFDLADLQKPKLIELPFLARKDGFGTTPRPGMITWKRDAGILEAETGTDLCPSSMLRHSYRPGFTEGWISSSATFVVVRVEVSEKGCGQRTRWTTIWEAAAWPESAAVR